MAYGPFHRVEYDPGQTPAIAQAQLTSGELWGWPARNIYQSNLPCAKALRGPLPSVENGIEFFTDVAPSAGSGNRKEARWYHGTPGVSLGNHNGDTVAVIPIVVTLKRP